MRIPDCPVCKTNINVVRDYDVGTHTGGVDKDGNYCCSYSDSFECTCCGGRIYYHEERVADKICDIELTYRQKNYTPIRRVVG